MRRHAGHERREGREYPDKLVATGIPLPARIPPVRDADHAMTSGRLYRRALPVTAALEALRGNAGTQFDPAVIAVLIKAEVPMGAMPEGPVSQPPAFGSKRIVSIGGDPRSAWRASSAARSRTRPDAVRRPSRFREPDTSWSDVPRGSGCHSTDIDCS